MKQLQPRTERCWPMAIAVLAPTIALFVVTALMLSTYYSDGLPYYDSVGSYVAVFRVMSTVTADGFVAGITEAREFAPSWLQSFFGAMFAWLPRTPATLSVLNFGLLCLSQLAIYSVGREIGYGRLKSLVATLLPLTPAALFAWDGGYLDMRRDPSMLALLTLVVLLFWLHVWRPGPMRGVMLGTSIGLALWSRGNAAPYVMVAVVSPALVLWLLKRGEDRPPLQAWITPGAVAVLVASPYYLLTFAETLNKYLTGSWALGVTVWESIRHFWVAPAALMLIGTRGVDRASISLALVWVAVALGIVVLLGTGHLRFDVARYKSSRVQQILATGVVVVVLVMVLNCGVIKVAANAGWIPFFPVLIGVYFAAIALLAGFVGTPGSELVQRTTVVLLAITVVSVGAVRTHYGRPATTSGGAQLTRHALEIQRVVSDARVAWLWSLHPNVHDANFFLSKSGLDVIQATSVLAPGVDVEMPPNPSQSVAEQNAGFLRALDAYEFVVVCDEPGAYANEDEFFFLYREGQPVVDRLLSARANQRLYSFEHEGRNFVLLGR